ncbi:MAG: hypothetical protein OSJ36_09780 [Odoribacter sp.]|nr:hypothetical protein [Odoribacter sp.]
MTRNKPSRPELKFHFHNPNTPEETVALLLYAFYDMQRNRARKAIDEAASENEENHHPD